MHELEEKIAAWCARLKRSLPADDEIVRELEQHLRDDIAEKCRAGLSPREAFETSSQRLGDPEAIAREFGRVRSRWFPGSRPVRAVLALVAVGVFAMISLLGWVTYGGKMTPLLFSHVVIVSAGYYAVAGAGLLGAWALLTTIWRPLSVTERRDLRTSLFGLGTMGSVLVPVGIVLGMFWAADNLGRAWGWDPLELGGLLALCSTWLLLLVQTRRNAREDVCWLLAIVGGIGVDLQLGAKAFHLVMPAWLCVVLIAWQITIFMFRRKEIPPEAVG